MHYSNAAIARYYHETRWQYYGLWSKQNSLALHYGYWDAQVRSHAQALLRLNAVVADRVSIGPGDHVLDAGCGWGGSSIWLAAKRGARCTGISLEGDQIMVARRMAAKRKVAATTCFALGDFTATDYPDASFDVVWALESVCHAADKRDFLREAFRVLKPGGRLVLADFFRTQRPLTEQGEAHLHAWLDKWAVPDLDTQVEFRQSMAATGFAEPQVLDATDNIRPAAKRLYRTGLWTTPLARLFRWLRIHSTVQDANWRSSLVQYSSLQAGLWCYGIASAHKPGND